MDMLVMSRLGSIGTTVTKFDTVDMKLMQRLHHFFGQTANEFVRIGSFLQELAQLFLIAKWI